MYTQESTEEEEWEQIDHERLYRNKWDKYLYQVGYSLNILNSACSVVLFRFLLSL